MMKFQPKSLSQILDSKRTENHELMIHGLAMDSRKVRPGWLFAALPKTKSENSSMPGLSDAIERGAVAILTTPETKLPPETSPEVAHITHPNPRSHFAHMNARFHQNIPSNIIAVTGTNGKTSVAMFTRHIWTVLGVRSASIGTLGTMAGKHCLPSVFTTPRTTQLHRILSMLGRRKFTHVILEASSHGLAEYRLDGVPLTAAVFTRLGEDHMDYHTSRTEYLETKLRLVRELLPRGSSFICDEQAPGAKEAIRAAMDSNHKLLRVGGPRAEIYIQQCTPTAHGQKIEIVYENKTHHILFPLAARFQAINALMAAACVLGFHKEDPAKVFAALESMPPTPGRLEKVGHKKNGASIFIDYAHTPDALETALKSLRESLLNTTSKLIVVFGCGGNRDMTKRPRMGKIAHKLADHVIVTDDNSRFENAADIREQILSSCPGGKNIGDRAKAICAGIQKLQPQDILLIAGKGHEKTQEQQGQRIDFSDQKVVQEFLSSFDNKGSKKTKI